MAASDIFIIIGIFLFMLLGFRDGLFKKIFAILGLLSGLACATKFMVVGSEYITNFTGLSKEISNVLSFFLIFMIVVIFENLLYRWFGRTDNEPLSMFSRFAGAFVGFFQGIVVMSLILLMLSIYEIPSEETKHDSELYNMVIKTAPKVFNITTSWMPESKLFFDELKGQFEHFAPSK